MFGGLLLLPQYLQIVHGSSATVAGLQMIPLVAGIMIGAMSSGIAISKTGKYKVFPLAGTTLMTAALLALSVVVGAKTDRKSTRLNSSHANISYAVFCLKKKIKIHY